MKSALSTVQSLHKLGRILSQLYFVLSIISLVLSFAAPIVLLNAPDLRESIDTFLINKTSYGVTTLYGVCSTIFIFAFGEIFVSRKAVDYFKSELEYGTPFSKQNAEKLKRLGIMTLIIPIVTHTLAAVTYNILSDNLAGMAPFKFHMTGSIVLAFMFIIASLLCKSGAEKANQ